MVTIESPKSRQMDIENGSLISSTESGPLKLNFYIKNPRLDIHEPVLIQNPEDALKLPYVYLPSGVQYALGVYAPKKIASLNTIKDFGVAARINGSSLTKRLHGVSPRNSYREELIGFETNEDSNDPDYPTIAIINRVLTYNFNEPRHFRPVGPAITEEDLIFTPEEKATQIEIAVFEANKFLSRYRVYQEPEPLTTFRLELLCSGN